MEVKSWFSSAQSAKLLDRARSLLRDRDRWANDLREKDDTSLDSLLNDATNYEASKESLQREIRTLEEEAHALIQTTSAKREALNEKRGHGAGKAASRMQRFLTGFSDFLSSYSGIVDCVSAADNHFGGLAWSTLSIFLKVATNKRDREDLLEDEIREITRYFPRLTTWHDVYPNHEFDTESRIAEAYVEIILFARDATKYYCYSSWRRVASASKPKAAIESRIEKIRKDLTDIKSDCEAMMHSRIQQLSHDVKRLKLMLEEKNDEEDTRNLTRLHHSLHLPKVRANKQEELRYYNNLLHSAFLLQDTLNVADPPSMTWDILIKNEEFLQWYEGMDAGLLLLSGYSWEGFSHTTLSWLSRAATLLTEQLKNDQKIVASVFCQQSSMMLDNCRISTMHMLGELMYQLATTRPRFLRGEGVALNSLVTCDEWNSEDEGTALEAAMSAIVKLLSAFDPEDTVYFVLDRIDQCHHGENKKPSGVSEVLLGLLRVVRTATCKVKVLVVTGPAKSSIHSVANRASRREWKDLRQACLEKVDWHQGSASLDSLI